MDVPTGLAPRGLKRAFVVQRYLIPSDIDAIDRLFRYLSSVRPTMAEILISVCQFYLVTPAELESRKRNRVVSQARMMFCYLSRKYVRASMSAIGMRIGDRHHTTVLHAIRTIECFSVTRPVVRDDLDLLRLRICEKLLLRVKDWDHAQADQGRNSAVNGTAAHPHDVRRRDAKTAIETRNPQRV